LFVALLAAQAGLGQEDLVLRPEASVTIAQEAYLKASNTDPTDLFGGSVAISGDTLVIGAPRESSGANGIDGDQTDDSVDTAGAAYVFVLGPGGWKQQAYLKASNSGLYDSFGGRVAISGDTLVVGAYAESSGASGVGGDQSDDGTPSAGAVYVFERQGGLWSQSAYLKASNPDAADRFGSALAVHQDTIVVGARLEDGASAGVNGDQASDGAEDSGAVYVFERDLSNWIQTAYLKASNVGAGDAFGRAVAVQGDRLVVGAPYEDSAASGVNGDQTDDSLVSSGAVYVFRRRAAGGTGPRWVQEAYLKADEPAVGQDFGRNLALDAGRILVGSRFTGAYLFERAGGNWSLRQRILPPSYDPLDEPGFNVALRGDLIVIGAPLEDGSATGVNGDGSDDESHSAGAAYLFVESGPSWLPMAYLKASNTQSEQYFGVTLALDGERVLVGATGESSAATGVNGEQDDTSADGAGAVYAFRVPTSELGTECFGDGTGATCPCFNFGSPGAGCQGSSLTGAELSASGRAYAELDLLSLSVSGSTPGAPGILFRGSALPSGGTPLGDGLLCLAPERRFGVRFADASGRVLIDPGLAVEDAAAAPGATLRYQWWYRDPGGDCGGGFNLSNALIVRWR